MNPVTGHTMLNFIHWLATTHPEVQSLREIDEVDILNLVDEFEGGKLSNNRDLKEKWRNGFYTLLKTNNSWKGYDEARRELETIER
jgi:hypothetical protein